MGWFDFLWKRDVESPQQVTPDQTSIVDDVLLQALLNGETITRDKVMTLPTVNGAVDFISNCIASMPVKLYKYKEGRVEEVEKDDRVKMLNGDTGDTLDAFQMKKAMVSDFLLGKGGYCYIRRNRNDVTGLFYVEDRFVEIMKVYEPIFKTYTLLVMGQEYKPWQFIKLLRNTKDGASGVGLTVEVSKALETAYQTLLYQLGMVSTGGNKRGFLKSQKKLGQDEINTLKKAWANLYANNNENVVVLNNGLEFQEASNSAVETQLNESKKTLQDEINALFHLYPDDFERTFKEAIYPIVKAFETALNRDLLLEKEKKNHFFEFDVKEIVRVSIKERYEAYKLAKETGFMTLNEIRRRENMPFIEGLDVVNVGLGAVLYDTNKHVYYTPNTDTIGDIGDGGSNESLEEKEAEEKKTQDMLLGHVLSQEFDESGNSSAREIEERYNDVHDLKTGRFGSKGGSGGSSSGGSGGGGTSPSKMPKGYNYIRFGKVPEGEQSINYTELTNEQKSLLNDEVDIYGANPIEFIKNKIASGDPTWKNLDESKVFEKGVSVFKADKNGLPILENKKQVNSLLMRLDDEMFAVSGKEKGKGQDGEPILHGTKSKKMNPSKQDLIARVEETLKANYKDSVENDGEKNTSRLYEFADWRTGETEYIFNGVSYKNPKSSEWE